VRTTAATSRESTRATVNPAHRSSDGVCGAGGRPRPVAASGPTQSDRLLQAVGVATGPACDARIDHVRVKTELDILSERLRMAARAVRRDLRIETQRRGGIVVLPGEHADRVGVCWPGGRLSVPRYLARARSTRARTHEHGSTDRDHKQCLRTNHFGAPSDRVDARNGVADQPSNLESRSQERARCLIEVPVRAPGQGLSFVDWPRG